MVAAEIAGDNDRIARYSSLIVVLLHHCTLVCSRKLVRSYSNDAYDHEHIPQVLPRFVAARSMSFLFRVYG